jgi:hypothetical protein
MMSSNPWDIPVDENKAEILAKVNELEWQKTLATVPPALRVLCDILSPDNLHPVLEKLRSGSIGTFEKFVFPMVRAVWPSLIATDLVTVQTMTAPRNFTFFNNNSSPTGISMTIKENAHNNYIDKIQRYVEEQCVIHAIEEDLVKYKLSTFTEVQRNFFYSLMVRNPFKFTNDEVPVLVQYCYLMDMALVTFNKLKNSNYLKSLTDAEIHSQLTEMQILSPFPVEDHYTDASQRDCQIWYVLVQLFEYSMIGEKSV